MVRYIITLLACLCLAVPDLNAQFQVAQPLPPGTVHIPTDTVYMAPDGDDLNTGTWDSPVATFARALQLLPFGIAGVDGGNAYGLVRLKPGMYELEGGMVQHDSQWKSGSTYKNVSVEGIGDVEVRGEGDNFSATHLVRLMGSYIFIRNLHLRFAGQSGVLIGRGSDLPRQHNVYVESVEVDSAKDFSMLIFDTDTVLIRDSKGLFASRPGSDDLTSPCAWPSGIKFIGCSHATIHDSEIAYTRGEGLNFQNSLFGLAYGNRLHDNPSNFYNDNSALLIIRDNYIYNDPDADIRYWRTCPANTGDKVAGVGILLANEGSCPAPVSGGTYSFCYTVCTGSPDIRNVDSIFIYNNIMHNTGRALSFWEGRIDNLTGGNCIRNVYFHNNTIVDLLWADSTLNETVVNAAFGSYFVLGNAYSIMRNVHISDNIFSFPGTAQLPNLRPVLISTHPLAQNPVEMFFDNNLWSRPTSVLSATEEVRSDMPFEFPLFGTSMEDLRPCGSVPEYSFDGAAYPYMSDDHSGAARATGMTNVGALEATPGCIVSAAADDHLALPEFEVYPNPGTDVLIVKSAVRGNFKLEIIGSNGQLVRSGENLRRLITSDLADGVYLVRMRTAYGSTVRKWVKLP